MATLRQRFNRSSRTRTIVLCALCDALLIVSCFFTVPLGPVPFTLQTLVVLLIALILTPRQAVVTVAIYLLLGAVGLPFFSSMTGGLGHLLGPTGGFLFSYLIIAFGGSWLRGFLVRRHLNMLVTDVIVIILMLAVSYLIGWAWYMVVAGLTPLEAFAGAVAPFIVIDVCKGIAAAIVASPVRIAVGPGVVGYVIDESDIPDEEDFEVPGEEAGEETAAETAAEETPSEESAGTPADKTATETS
ncbi:MAG: biotin transporter BioY [Coriobacteriaceae bacterium]|nr:biotin transporter BioY [Coriobacteriaceae bacterium]